MWHIKCKVRFGRRKKEKNVIFLMPKYLILFTEEQDETKITYIKGDTHITEVFGV